MHRSLGPERSERRPSPICRGASAESDRGRPEQDGRSRTPAAFPDSDSAARMREKASGAGGGFVMSQPLPPRFEDLLSRYLDSTLTEAEQAELAELLKDALLEKTFLEATRLGREIAGVLSKPISDDEMTALVDVDINTEEGSKIAPGKDTQRISAILDRIDR